jgi:hypothetical protein
MHDVSRDGESLVTCLEVGDYFIVVALDDVEIMLVFGF